jgi:predicted signal transduction protein with EAL and GGDEF domain
MSKKQISFSLATVVFVYLSVQHRWFPVWVHNITFPGVLFIVCALNVAGWWRLTRAGQDATTSRWRKRAALMGLIANTLAIAVPFAAFLYGIYIGYLMRRGPVKGSDIVDVYFALPVGLCLAVCGLLSGTLAPNWIRLPIVLGGVVTCLLILSIPIGIL